VFWRVAFHRDRSSGSFARASPFYIYTDPDRAKTLVDFRIQSLPGARENAEDYGYSGARYGWESDDRGRDSCAAWQYRDHQIHVTADVVYGMVHYARAVNNTDYLKSEASDVLLETSRYWLQRMDVRDGDDHPSLLGVMGPDEYSPVTLKPGSTAVHELV
jgi:trehalose/maltose hydrolase-like predicted phosphorylase